MDSGLEPDAQLSGASTSLMLTWGTVKIMVPFWVPNKNTGPNTGPNLGDPKRDHNFDNPPHVFSRALAIHHSLGFAWPLSLPLRLAHKADTVTWQSRQAQVE